MTQNLNSVDIDSVSLCNLAIETSALVANTGFTNTDLVIRAVSYFLEAIELDPSSYKAHLGLAILLMGGQMYEEAINFFQSAYDINPSDEIDDYINLCDEFKESQRSSKVEAVLSKKKATVSDLVDLGNKFKFK